MKQDNTFQVLNTSQTTPGGHWVMISRKNNWYFYGNSHQNPKKSEGEEDHRTNYTCPNIYI